MKGRRPRTVLWRISILKRPEQVKNRAYGQEGIIRVVGGESKGSLSWDPRILRAIPLELNMANVRGR